MRGRRGSIPHVSTPRRTRRPPPCQFTLPRFRQPAGPAAARLELQAARFDLMSHVVAVIRTNITHDPLHDCPAAAAAPRSTRGCRRPGARRAGSAPPRNARVHQTRPAGAVPTGEGRGHAVPVHRGRARCDPGYVSRRRVEEPPRRRVAARSSCAQERVEPALAPLEHLAMPV